MIWTASTNGRLNKASIRYRFAISAGDRAKFSEFVGRTLVVELTSEGMVQRTEVTISPTFLTTCPELYSAKIHDWLTAREEVPWARGRPPKFLVEPVDNRVFRIIRTIEG